MVSLPLVTLGLAAIGVYAKPAVRAPGDLEVSLLTPTDKVASMSDVRVVATVKNVGDEDLKILKFGTVLDDNHPTPSFIISKDGEDVPFTATAVCAPTFPTSCLVFNIPIGSGLYGSTGRGRLGCHPRRQECDR